MPAHESAFYCKRARLHVISGRAATGTYFVKNLLLFSIEDLNDWIEPLGGHPQAYTPNLQRLADMGALCTSAYAAAPACSPSRTATLFSRFPWETGVLSNATQWFDFFPYGKSISLIGKLKDAGFETIGAGKVFHTKGRSRTLDYSDWTEFHFETKVNYPKISKTVKARDLGKPADFGVDMTGVPSGDDINTDWMIERIKPGQTGKAWALGIFRPHLPFIAPQEFFDKIPEQVALPPGLGTNGFDPDNDNSHRNLPDPAKRFAVKQSKTGHALHRNGEYEAFLRAYLASIAYADSKLGMVLDHLERCDLMKDTLVVLWSDHGWQLGEKLAFRKFTLWERALRVPVIFAGGDIPRHKVTAPISLVDIAPTILNLMGVQPSAEFSGQDITQPLMGTGTPERLYAPSIWGVGFRNNPRLAYSVRTEKYRYIRYWNGSSELYDHHVDPFEHDNLSKSEDPDVQKEKEQLEEYVRAIEIDPATLPAQTSSSAGDDDDDDDA